MANDGAAAGTATQTQTPAAQAAPPQAPAQTSAAPSDWTSSFDADLKGYVQNKGFADPKMVVESYRNFEKLQGVPKERILQLPESLESPEARAVWERLGAPKEAKEYKLDIPKEHGDEKLSGWAQETFHKLNVPRSMAEGFVKAFNERQGAMLKESQEAHDSAVLGEHTTLQKEWGNAYKQNESIANQAANKFGLTPDEVKSLGAALGPAKAMKFLHKLGEGTGEAGFIDGKGGSAGALSPEAAQSEIRGLMKDTDFARRLSSKDSDAVSKWDRLHQMANPGSMSV